MSSMSYQSPDASQNVELKKGNIASFFKSGDSAKTAKASTRTLAAADIKSEPHASSQAEQRANAIKADVTGDDHARLRASSAHLAGKLATDTLDHQGKHDEAQGGSTGQRQPQSSHQSADQTTAPEVNGPVHDVDKEEPAEDDVLNTDDAGGIGALYLQHVNAFVQFPLYFARTMMESRCRGYHVTRFYELCRSMCNQNCSFHWPCTQQSDKAICMQWQSQSQAVYCSTAHHQQSVLLLQPGHQPQQQRREKQKREQLKAFLVAKAEVVTKTEVVKSDASCLYQVYSNLNDLLGNFDCDRSSTSYCVFPIGLL